MECLSCKKHLWVNFPGDPIAVPVLLLLFYICVNREDMCIYTANGAQQLLKLLLSELLITDNQVDVIKSSITLLLYAICKMEILVAQKKLDEAVVEKAFTTCGKALQEWVKRRGVMGVQGGSSFGYKTQGKMKMLYGSTELKVGNCPVN